MAKKKNLQKKHKFKYAEGTGAAAPASASAEQAVREPKTMASARPAAATGVTTTRDFSYVGVDLRRIGIIVGSLIAVEVILYFLFNRTGLGPAVYNLVKV